MPDSEVHGAPVSSLVSMLDEFKPFLDASGQGYAFLPHEEPEKRLPGRMNDHRLRCVLFYLFLQNHEQEPTWGQIYKAIALVHGRLLKDRQGPNSDLNDPTLEVFIKAAIEHEGWAGSAKDLLCLLRETQTAHKVVKDTHRLPDSPTATGIWLSTNLL